MSNVSVYLARGEFIKFLVKPFSAKNALQGCTAISCRIGTRVQWLKCAFFQKHKSSAEWQTGSTWGWMRSSRLTRVLEEGEGEVGEQPGGEGAGEPRGEGTCHKSLRYFGNQNWILCQFEFLA